MPQADHTGSGLGGFPMVFYRYTSSEPGAPAGADSKWTYEADETVARRVAPVTAKQVRRPVLRFPAGRRSGSHSAPPDLTERQFNAAEAYGRLRGRFDRMMEMPRRSARSCLYDIEAWRTSREMSEAAMTALRDEHAALLSGVECGLGVARVAITAGGARRVLDGAVAQQARQARAGRTVAMLDRIVLDDEAPLPGELPSLTAALDVLVVLFKTGERR